MHVREVTRLMRGYSFTRHWNDRMEYLAQYLEDAVKNLYTPEKIRLRTQLLVAKTLG